MASKPRYLCPLCLAQALQVPSHPALPLGLKGVCCGPRVSEATRALVHGLKYQGHRRAAIDLVDLARTAVDDGFCPASSVLVPVPLHPHRKRERGYNQSALLAAQWQPILARPLREAFLQRVVDTQTQTRLDASHRRSNLESAFKVGKAFVRDVPVVLIDDVLTTGATLSACAAVLLAAGAPSVSAICVMWAGEA